LGPASLSPAAVNMLRGSEATFDLKGDLELGTRFGQLSMPYHQTGKTLFER
jgi:hypothetical protein